VCLSLFLFLYIFQHFCRFIWRS